MTIRSRPRTFAMQLLVGFSIVASVLTLVGVYGVLSLSVASRRREIAVRSAVGAQRRDIRKLVFADAFRLIAGGVVAGIVAAIVLSRGLTSFLFEVEPTDPADARRRWSAVRHRRAARLLGAEPARGADRSARGAAQRIGPHFLLTFDRSRAYSYRNSICRPQGSPRAENRSAARHPRSADPAGADARTRTTASAWRGAWNSSPGGVSSQSGIALPRAAPARADEAG